jgi:hypothetical protein
MGLERVLRHVEMLTAVQERFTGDATYIKAGTAQATPLVDYGCFEAQLRSSDSSHVAARSCANHDAIERRVTHFRLNPVIN